MKMAERGWDSLNPNTFKCTTQNIHSILARLFCHILRWEVSVIPTSGGQGGGAPCDRGEGGEELHPTLEGPLVVEVRELRRPLLPLDVPWVADMDICSHVEESDQQKDVS